MRRQIKYFKSLINPDLNETGCFTNAVYFRTNKYPRIMHCVQWLIDNGHKPIEYVQGCSGTEGFSIPKEITEDQFINHTPVIWNGIYKQPIVVSLIEEDDDSKRY